MPIPTDSRKVGVVSEHSRLLRMRRHTGGAASLAILAPVGEIDPLGTRRDGLDAFLDQKVLEGYVIETRSDTHAIIFRRRKASARRVRNSGGFVFVDESAEQVTAVMG
jgi:hypothetical protein